MSERLRQAIPVAIGLALFLGALEVLRLELRSVSWHALTADILATPLSRLALATALALVFSELLQNALEHGGSSVRVELARRDGEVVLAIADDGAGVDGEPVSGTGLSIVRALVRDELGGTLSLESNRGLRAEVVFPA